VAEVRIPGVVLGTTCRPDEVVMLQIASIWSTPASMFLFPWGESTVTLEDDVLGGLPLLSRPRRDVLLLQLFFDWSCCWYFLFG
jgi:hypothetical protein